MYLTRIYYLRWQDPWFLLLSCLDNAATIKLIWIATDASRLCSDFLGIGVVFIRRICGDRVHCANHVRCSKCLIDCCCLYLQVSPCQYRTWVTEGPVTGDWLMLVTSRSSGILDGVATDHLQWISAVCTSVKYILPSKMRTLTLQNPMCSKYLWPEVRQD